MPIVRDVTVPAGSTETYTIYVPQGKRIKGVEAANLTGLPVRCRIHIRDTIPTVNAINVMQCIAEGIISKATTRAFYRSLWAFLDILPSRDYEVLVGFQFFNDTSSDIKVLCAVMFDEEAPILTKRARP